MGLLRRVRGLWALEGSFSNRSRLSAVSPGSWRSVHRASTSPNLQAVNRASLRPYSHDSSTSSERDTQGYKLVFWWVFFTRCSTLWTRERRIYSPSSCFLLGAFRFLFFDCVSWGPSPAAAASGTSSSWSSASVLLNSVTHGHDIAENLQNLWVINAHFLGFDNVAATSCAVTHWDRPTFSLHFALLLLFPPPPPPVPGGTDFRLPEVQSS